MTPRPCIRFNKNLAAGVPIPSAVLIEMPRMDKQPTPCMTKHASDCPRASLSSGTTLRMALAAGLVLSLAACPSRQRQPGTQQATPLHTISANNKPLTCTPAELAFSLDSGDGRFNGMSHSGTRLILHNIGTTACTVPIQPLPAFSNASKGTLGNTAQGSSDSTHASMPPITLMPGATVSSDMSWVSSNVYDNGHCESPTSITLTLDKQTVTSNFTGHMCGPNGKPLAYTLTPFRAGPALAMAAASKTLTYTCDNGHTVQAAYPDTDTAVLTMDGQTHQLHIAISADGARYVGKHWQWWTKGMREGRLAPLHKGETIAAAPGVACATR